MPNNAVFELIEEIDFTTFPGILYQHKEDAWKNLGYIIDKFIEVHTDVNITGFEIDQKQSTVCIKYDDKRTSATHYRYYAIRTRIVH